MTQETLPFDPVAEASLIGSIWSGLSLGSPESRVLLFDLEPGHFLGREHRLIWAGMQKLVMSREALSEIGLCWAAYGGKAEDAQRSELAEVLLTGQDLEPSPLKARVEEMYLRRVALKEAHNLSVAARDTTLEPAALLDAANHSFMAVAKLSGSGRNNRIRQATELVGRVGEGMPFKSLDPGGAIPPKLLTLGLPSFDDAIEAAPGHIVILAARPGSGKTALAIQASSMTATKGVPTLFVSLEMDEDEFDARLASYWVDGNYKDFRSGRFVEHKDTFMHSLRGHVPALGNLFSWYHPSGIPMGKLCSFITEAVVMHGVRAVVIDYFHLIGISREKGDTLAYAYAANSAALKKLAQELRISILLLAQLNRDKDDGSRPSMSDLKETSQLEQDANAILFLYRKPGIQPISDMDPRFFPNPANRTLFPVHAYLAKNRDGETLEERLATPFCNQRFFVAPQQV